MKAIVEMIHGSHLYGTDTPESDTDYKGIYLPDLEDCYLGRINHTISTSTGDPNGKNTSVDVDIETFSLQRFIQLACNGETCILDMLHAPPDSITKTSEIWETLQRQRSRFYTKNMTSFLGYCRKQASKYGVKGSRLADLEQVILFLKERAVRLRFISEVWDSLPNLDHAYKELSKEPRTIGHEFYVVCGRKLQKTISIDYAVSCLDKIYTNYGERAKQAKENNGIDWKAISHAFRAGYQLREIYKTGDLIFPLKDRDFIKQIKNGEFHFTDDGISEKLDALINEVELLASISEYPESVDKEYWNQFIIDVYKNTGCDSL